MTQIHMDQIGAADDCLGKRERAKAANRDAILTSAAQVFAEIGFDAATVRDIIRGTDLAAGTFYNYFKSKEEVFAALADERAQRLLPRLQAARVQAESLEEYLRRALNAYYSFVVHEHPGERSVVERRPHTRTDTPGIKAVYEELHQGVLDAVARGLTPKIDACLLSAAIIGIGREVAEIMLTRKPVDIDAATQFSLGLIVSGVAGVKATPLA